MSLIVPRKCRTTVPGALSQERHSTWEFPAYIYRGDSAPPPSSWLAWRAVAMIVITAGLLAQSAETVLGILRERGIRGLPGEEL
ncbi:hypothetical protein ACFXOM_08875 [Streptomyces sp. NPDC059169]|uniref:hypothetical protein n=1 Tax=unclassified Streptomyces TaxID=2593676 RepID=UPI0036A5558C